MLEVRDLHVHYGSIRALKGISLEVKEGEMVALIGANGAGKTTLLNTLSGFNRPKQGEILFRGGEIQGLPPNEIVARGMIQVPEGRSILTQMTVLENLEMGAYIRKDSQEVRRSRPPGPPSFSWSKTPGWPCGRPTGGTCWRMDRSFSRSRPGSS
jgi:branched-chain amino acid transport system ATP-binding protein